MSLTIDPSLVLDCTVPSGNSSGDNGGNSDGANDIEDFIMYPNPNTTGLLTVEKVVTDGENFSIYVLDLMENTIINTTLDTDLDGVISVSIPPSVPNGIYVVRISSTFDIETKQLILNR
ncbi:MAG: T9SS type A sorting domain-containing protein [Flavobacteriaceae bacterium]|nr:T9SS type A sorting domain-containing protein [Flavobacteriaceae bacterium]